uniref:Secreted protein n=1 Tax=Panagrellus redivivus TaxID=6233 RepID=A0A7E4UTI7_PANRE
MVPLVVISLITVHALELCRFKPCIRPWLSTSLTAGRWSCIFGCVTVFYEANVTQPETKSIETQTQSTRGHHSDNVDPLMSSAVRQISVIQLEGHGHVYTPKARFDLDFHCGL